MIAEVDKKKEEKSSCKMTFHVTDAKKMLASVSRIVEAGNEVIFGERSWIRNKGSGKCIRHGGGLQRRRDEEKMKDCGGLWCC